MTKRQPRTATIGSLACWVAEPLRRADRPATYVRRIANLALSIALAAFFLSEPSWAQTPPKLRQVGALHCNATKAKGSAKTALVCELRMPDVRVKADTFTGEMFGTGVHFVAPGGIQVLWNVLAPTARLDPSMIAGHYDTVSEHPFAYARGNSDLLVGGFNDVVGLELVAPTVGAITPSTRLTLRHKD